MRPKNRSRILAGWCSACLLVAGAKAADVALAKELGDYVAKADGEAERTRTALKLPAGFRAEVWARHPLLADPVAIAFDGKGRLYVAEHHRNRHGTEDDREHRYWLDDDFAARSVEDRLAFMEKWAAAGKKPMRFYTEIPDRLVCIEDRDGDGRAETTRTLALFGDPLDGANVGVLPRDGEVWVTNIPHLWRFRDDGKSEQLQGEKVFSGFGVKFSLHGHDMHGLVIGPDGRLYWSIGDRGFNVRTREGGTVSDLWRGAVFRCELDGSKLEVFCTGLRNPQELVFDDLGNLFTVDNDNDAADEQPRVLHLVEDGDYGWHNGNIWPDDRVSALAPHFRRPWYEDGLWQARFAEQPAWVMPPIAHLSNGPCGLAREPGVTLVPDAWQGSFFVTDWRSGKSSPVIRFTLEPRGNGFALTGTEEFLNGMLPTDVEFGPDGRMYVSDMVAWELAPGGGRRAGRGSIFALSADVGAEKRSEVARMQGWFKTGFARVEETELIDRLGHRDYRVRLEAQLALANRDDATEALVRVARTGKDLRARVHALQALGQMQRRGGRGLQAVVGLLQDSDGEVRAQVAKQLADTPVSDTAGALKGMLRDPVARVRFFAAMALSRTPEIADQGTVDAVAAMLRMNRDEDAYLRHAGVVALTRATVTESGRAAVERLATDEAPAVRIAVLLAQRRRGVPVVAQFLNDADSRLRREAVRAIHDKPMGSELGRVAELTGQLAQLDAATGRRVLNARFRLGRVEDANALAAVAADDRVPAVMRREALALLAEWGEPSPRDRVTGEWAPLPKRLIDAPIAAARVVLRTIIQSAPPEVTATAVGLAAHYGISEVLEAVLAVARDGRQGVAGRVAAVRALQFLPPGQAAATGRELCRDDAAAVRAAARELLLLGAPEEGLKELAAVFTGTSVEEQQAAAVTLGGSMERRAFDLLAAQADAVTAGKRPRAVALDIFEAMEKALSLAGLPNAERTRRSVAQTRRVAAWSAQFPESDPLRAYRVALEGGDPQRGRELFHQKVELQCVRCHRTEGRGNSDVGPDLTGIGKRASREYLLRSIVEPAAELARGFDYATLTLRDGRVVSGLVQQETATELQVTVPGEPATAVTVRKDDITGRQAISPMPPLVGLMSARELRDLVEYLSVASDGQPGLK